MTQRTIAIITLFSISYILLAVSVESDFFLFGTTLSLILLNLYLSFSALFKRGELSPSIIFLNSVQLILFSLLNYQLYSLSGATHYQYSTGPSWFDWPLMIGIHIFKALDIIDIIEAYGIQIQNIQCNSVLSGSMLVTMHIVLDIFVFNAVFKFLNRRFNLNALTQNPMFQLWLKRTQISLLIVAMAYFLYVFMQETMGDIFRANLLNSITWPLDNFLRTLDIGDAFQTFNWHLHTLPQTVPMATAAVCFRLVVGSYTITIASRMYFKMVKGTGATVMELGNIFASNDRSAEERIIAANALVKFGAQAVPAVPALKCAFEASHSKIRAAGIQTLNHIGTPALYDLVKMLPHPSAHVNRRILTTLGRIDPNWFNNHTAYRALPHLIEHLADRSPAVRQHALAALSRIAPKWRQSHAAQKAIPVCIHQLDHIDSNQRLAAAETLRHIGPTAHLAIFRLTKRLADANGHVRAAALSALQHIDPGWQAHQSVHRAIPHILNAANHDDKEVRNAIPEALYRIGAKTVPVLMTALEESDVEAIVICAKSTLAKLSGVSIPCLVKALESHNERYIKRCQAVLSTICEPAIAPLVHVVTCGSAKAQTAAQTVLSGIGPKVIPYMIEAMARPDATSGPALINLIGEFEISAIKAVPYLKKALQSPATRQAAQIALERIEGGS